MTKRKAKAASPYEGAYVKTRTSPAFFLVQSGKRVPLTGPEDLFRYGLRPVAYLSQEDLDAIPLSGQAAKPAPEPKPEEAPGGDPDPD